jgi:anti-anti-sigma regulatory factor
MERQLVAPQEGTAISIQRRSAAGRPSVPLSSRRVGRTLVVSIQVRSLDLAAAGWENDLYSLVEHCDSAVLDLSALDYADHFGFQILLRAVQRCPGKVRFASVQPGVDSLFILLGLDRAISRFSTLEAALADAGDLIAAEGQSA